MVMVGAAVEDLQQLAKAMDSTGHRLSEMRAGIDHQVHGTRWTGPDGARFSHEWSTTYGPRLAAVGQALLQLASLLRKQAQEQAAASAAQGSTGGGVKLPPGTAPMPDRLITMPDLMTLRPDDLSWISRGLGDAALGVARQVADIAEKVKLPWVEKDLFDAVERVLHDRGIAASVGDLLLEGLLKTGLGEVGKVFDGVGSVFGIAQLIDDGSKLVDHAQSQGWNDETLFKSTDVIGDALQSAPGKASVVGWLGGVAVKQWTDVAREAEKMDFSTPLPPLTADNLTNIYLPSIGEGFVKTGQMLWGNL